MRRHLLTSTLLAATLLMLAACGGSSATGGPASSAPNPQSSPAIEPPPSSGAGQGGAVDAASLLTADMAAAVIGGSPKKVELPGQTAGGIMSLASYSTDSGDDVTILIQRLPGATGSAALKAAISQQGVNGDLQAVSGLGDGAGKIVGDHDATIAFFKGSTIVVLGANGSNASGSDLESKLESIAGQIAGKL